MLIYRVSLKTNLQELICILRQIIEEYDSYFKIFFKYLITHKKPNAPKIQKFQNNSLKIQNMSCDNKNP